MVSAVYDKYDIMSRHNNFDCLRLFAALLVLVSHSFALAGSPEPTRWLGDYDTGGGLGVAIFFVMSGYLVAGSVTRRSTSDYLASRALRILPALALVTCFEIFLIGPAFTTLPLSGYFTDPATWGRLANISVFGLSFSLPGVFLGLPYAAVNGSLWTLPAECGLYLVLPVVAFCGGLTKRGSIVIFTACFAAYFVATGYFGFGWKQQGPAILRGVAVFSGLRLATFFFAGAALWANRETISLHTGGAIIGAMLIFAAAGSIAAPAIYFLCVPYLVIFVALKLPPVPLEKIGDLSYGTYLFAFPVQQSIISLAGGHIVPRELIVITVPITLALALMSWRLVEQPALRWRKRKSATIVPMMEIAA